jgi:hypothetical protein
MDLSTMVAVWAVPWLIAVVVLLARAPRIGELEAASWLIVIGAFLVAMEDAGLPFWLGLVDSSIDPQRVAAIVHPHVRGHMLTAAGWTVVASVLAGWIARSPLRRGERWAWLSLLVAMLLGWGSDLAVAVLIFSHGLPLPGPGGQIAGFGWQPIAVSLGARAAGLALAYRPIFRPTPPLLRRATSPAASQ